MRIIIKDNSASPTTESVLCDGASRAVDASAGPADFACPARFLVEAQQFFRGTSTKNRLRDNGRSDIRFTVTRRCTSQEAALLWLVDHLATVTAKDTLLLIFDQDDGAVHTYTIPYVALEAIEHTPPTDATLRLTYVLRGGRPTVDV